MAAVDLYPGQAYASGAGQPLIINEMQNETLLITKQIVGFHGLRPDNKQLHEQLLYWYAQFFHFPPQRTFINAQLLCSFPPMSVMLPEG